MVSLSISRLKSKRSFLVYLPSSPFSLCPTSSSSRTMRFLISEKFERVPPIQRPATYGISSSLPAFLTASLASLLPPTQRAVTPSLPFSPTKASAFSSSLLVFSRFNLSRLFFEPNMTGSAEGCRRDLKKRKGAPTEKRAFKPPLPVSEVWSIFSIISKFNRKTSFIQRIHRLPAQAGILSEHLK